MSRAGRVGRRDGGGQVAIDTHDAGGAALDSHLGGDGAFVGVDTTQKLAVSGELYAVRLPYEGLVIKRVFLGPGGDVALRAENPQHPELTLAADKINDALTGRVVWTLNRY